MQKHAVKHKSNNRQWYNADCKAMLPNPEVLPIPVCLQDQHCWQLNLLLCPNSWLKLPIQSIFLDFDWSVSQMDPHPVQLYRYIFSKTMGYRPGEIKAQSLNEGSFIQLLGCKAVLETSVLDAAVFDKAVLDMLDRAMLDLAVLDATVLNTAELQAAELM